MNTLGVDIVLVGEEEEGQSDQHCGLYVGLNDFVEFNHFGSGPRILPQFESGSEPFHMVTTSILKEEKTGMTS